MSEFLINWFVLQSLFGSFLKNNKQLRFEFLIGQDFLARMSVSVLYMEDSTVLQNNEILKTNLQGHTILFTQC